MPPTSPPLLLPPPTLDDMRFCPPCFRSC
jgi:hypothetical protein